MWFWSVSWSTNCSVYFSFFLVDLKKIVQSQGIFGQSLMNKKDLRLDNFFFGRPKKMRNRPNNWSTKRLTKTTWTGLLSLNGFQKKFSIFLFISMYVFLFFLNQAIASGFPDTIDTYGLISGLWTSTFALGKIIYYWVVTTVWVQLNML